MIKFGENTETKPETLETYIHNYRLDISKSAQKKQYKELKLARTVKLFAGASGGVGTGKGNNLPDRVITLETKYVFNDQWNTADGFRVFDWHEEIYPNSNIKKGHYLDITPEMVELREKTYKCNYCGTEYYGHNNKGCFCSACLDSEYLKEENLMSLRLLAVSEPREYPDLTDAEKADLVPLYVERQTTGTNSRNAAKLRKQRSDIAKKYKNVTERAKIEHDGLLWLMDHNVRIDNVIFYTHTGRFGFGWRQPISGSVKDRLLPILRDFPFAYDINEGK